MIQVLDRLTESIQEHNPKAMQIAEPESRIDYNEFNANIRHQLKQIYDITRSIEAQVAESNRAHTANRR